MCDVRQAHGDAVVSVAVLGIFMDGKRLSVFRCVSRFLQKVCLI